MENFSTSSKNKVGLFFKVYVGASIENDPLAAIGLALGLVLVGSSVMKQIVVIQAKRSLKRWGGFWLVAVKLENLTAYYLQPHKVEGGSRRFIPLDLLDQEIQIITKAFDLMPVVEIPFSKVVKGAVEVGSLRVEYLAKMEVCQKTADILVTRYINQNEATSALDIAMRTSCLAVLDFATDHQDTAVYLREVMIAGEPITDNSDNPVYTATPTKVTTT